MVSVVLHPIGFKRQLRFEGGISLAQGIILNKTTNLTVGIPENLGLHHPPERETGSCKGRIVKLGRLEVGMRFLR
jgi:hypothetical protein